MNQAQAKIIASSTAGDAAVASGARISTTQGSALEIFARSQANDNNVTLIEKVAGSGHTSTLEHQFFTVAFDNVSVCTEEFVIEFRLGSYTVKSRRYVDFKDAGFYLPPLPGQLLPDYKAHMQSLFADYAALLALDIPKEDARYLLPYCFRSNFYCTMNARELLYMITVMCVGRGSYFPELKALGESLREQVRACFPKLPDLFEKRFPAGSDRYAPPVIAACPQPEVAQGSAELQHVSPVGDVLNVSAAFNFMSGGQPVDPDAVLHGERPRELEMIWARFAFRDLSLAAVTHLVRHRMQTVLVPQVTRAVQIQHYVLPESIKNNADACKIYTEAFSRNAEALNRMLSDGLPAEAVQYFALAGNQVDVLCAMNGRELLHFMKLRTCSRAQWEIRGVAVDLLRQLRFAEGSVFDRFGPSCFVTGKCPEGRLSCGKMAQMQEIFGGKL